MSNWIQTFQLSEQRPRSQEWLLQPERGIKEQTWKLRGGQKLRVVSSDEGPKAGGKGFILISPVNLWGLTLTWGRSWPSDILLDTLSNFCNFNILGKSFFSSFVEHPQCWCLSCLTRSELQGSRLTFKTKSANRKTKIKKKEVKKRSKLSSLLQVLNVHTSVHFSFAYVCRCSLCIHSLWLVASLRNRKNQFYSLLFALYISIWW